MTEGDKYKICKDIIFDTLSEESGLVIDSKNGCAYEVTETVCSILKLLKNSKTFNSLLEDILNEYEVDEETARKDLEEILTELVKCKIIEKV